MNTAALESINWTLVAILGGGALALVLGTLAALRELIHICEPNEILIFSGRRTLGADGGDAGFRVVTGGRALRIPILERVERMDMSLLSVPMKVSGAYSEGGIPLTVHAIANVKVSSDPKVVGNAIERFLGHDREAIATVAKETLEGHLRGVLANMTPEEVNEDRLKFADRLTEEASEDMHKLGLQLDTLKIQQVSDDRKYLESLGRTRVAEVLRSAEVAESDALRAAEEAEATASARGNIARSQAQALVQTRDNALRQSIAELDAEAKSEEARSIAAGQEARAEAERELQSIRARLEQLRLTADVTVPAEVNRQVRELEAAGEAAPIVENGRAMAQALETLSAAWNATGGQAMDIFVLQNLEELFGHITRAAGSVHVKHVSLMDSGDGATLAAYASAGPRTVGALLEEVSKTLGVDVARILQGGAGPKSG